MIRVRSIRNRLVLGLSVGLAVMAVSAGAGLYAFMDEVLEHELDSALAAKADAIIESVRIDNAGKVVFETVTAPSPHRDSPYLYQILDPQQHVMASAMPEGIPAARLDRPGGHKRFGNGELPDGVDLRVAERTFVPQWEDDDDPPASTRPAPPPLTLLLAHDRRSLNFTLAALLTGLLLAAGVLAGGMLLIVSLVVRRGLRPLADISAQADRVNPQSLQLRFPTPADLPTEIAPIAGKLNDLLDRIQKAFERERRFSAAVAHELRTPIAELRTLCEVSLRYPDQNSSPAPLQESLAIATEMSTLVESLMRLAKCQAGVMTPGTERIDLGPALDEWSEPFQDVAQAKGMTFELNASGPISSDRLMLKIVISNLLANAVAYTPTGGRVSVRSEAIESRIRLRVGNTTDQLTPADIEHLTSPFWRKDAARTGPAHAGLGLSIVDAYCRVLQMPLTFGLPSADFFEVNLDLPAAQSRTEFQ